jgi:hypothetical protein
LIKIANVANQCYTLESCEDSTCEKS